MNFSNSSLRTRLLIFAPFMSCKFKYLIFLEPKSYLANSSIFSLAAAEIYFKSLYYVSIPCISCSSPSNPRKELNLGIEND
jgi:hypothetical protein